jgi:hypothetical protein
VRACHTGAGLGLPAGGLGEAPSLQLLQHSPPATSQQLAGLPHQHLGGHALPAEALQPGAMLPLTQQLLGVHATLPHAQAPLGQPGFGAAGAAAQASWSPSDMAGVSGGTSSSSAAAWNGSSAVLQPRE